MTTRRETRSKSQLAYDLIHGRILDGQYGPGQRLVLDTIGRELGISVVPVREAIRRLEAEGLVSFARNIGARVAEIDASEYHETMETLSYVEGAALHLAAPLISPSRIARARAINEQLRALGDHFDPVQFSRINEQFHRELSDACPNSHLRDLVDRGWRRLGRLRQSVFGFVPMRAQEAVVEHEQILHLLESHADPRIVELQVRAHRLATPYAYYRQTAGRAVAAE